MDFASRLTSPFAGRGALRDWLRGEGGRRAIGIVVAIALELLLLLALLSLGQSRGAPDASQFTEVDLSAQDYREPAPEQPASEPVEPAAESEPIDQPAETATAPIVPTPPPAAVIPLRPAPPAPEPQPSPQPTARADVRIGPAQGPPAPRGAAPGDSEQVGTAPDGQPLYAARWYREPRDDELRGYLSTANAPGWGLIACKTAPDYRVEECVPIAESPGSMMNRAVLAAAWQFKVRPPRLGGRNLVGAWVRIRIDYTITGG